MRIVKNPQIQIGEIDISQIKFNPKSRDDIPQVLRGLQYLYVNIPIRQEIFSLLEKNISPKINKNNGRPGMELWKIFVMGVLRLDLNLDYDRLHHIVNYDSLIRQMLGHGIFDKEGNYELQTIKDNVSLLMPELLDEINQIVVRAGHQLVKKKETYPLHGRSDSFVVETHVHFPTDINLLLDAMRKVITLSADLSERYGLSDWRQHAYNFRQVKRLMRSAQNKKRVGAKTEEKIKKRDGLIVEAHKEYIDVVQQYLNKARGTLKTLEKIGLNSIQDIFIKDTIENFFNHAVRQINQISRRVIFGEIIPHNEKVFSLFQPHTEWISKGKAGVPVELGLRVCILEDQNQFILHHIVMEKQTDDQVAVEIVKETKNNFSNLESCSFDKGFHSQENQKALSEQLKMVILPRKGRLSRQARLIESSEEFIKAKEKHSAVESAINALEVHGLDICPDHGIDGFKRYVALAIVSRNIQRIGAILKQHEQKRKEKIKKYSHCDITRKKAA
ncbi:MAG: ISNCY family transposase [Ginsengibacter sp.]